MTPPCRIPAGICRRAGRIAAALVALCVLSHPSICLARDAALGRQIYKKGESAFAMGNYARAAALFQQAYELSQRPQLLWNLAAAHRKWFDLDHDIAHLRQAQKIYDNYADLIGDAKEVAEARREISALDKQVAELERHGVAARAATAAPLVSAEPRGVGAALAPSPSAPSSPSAPGGITKEKPTHADADSSANTVTATRISPAPVAQAKSKRWIWGVVAGVVVVGAGLGIGLSLGLPSDAATPSGLNSGTYRPMWP